MALALVVAMAATIPMASASAATKGVKLYFQNTLGWSQVYVYFWSGSGTITGNPAWPGAKMTKVTGTDNWYEFTYTGDKAFNAVFNDNGTPKPKQTANHDPKDLAISAEAYWFTPASGSTDNPDGISGGTKIVVHTTAETGYPTPAKAPVSSSPKASSATASGTKDSSPKTGDSGNTAAAVVVGTVSLAGLCAVLMKRKVKA